MTYHAAIDADGRATGFYHDGLHGAAIPSGAVPISEDTWRLWIGDTQRQRWDGAALVPCDPPPPAAPPPIRAIAPYAFRQRLPAATRRAITLAASQALEAGDATLQTWLDDLSSTRLVLLDHPDIASGVAMLRAAGLITESQATALLADGTAEEV